MPRVAHVKRSTEFTTLSPEVSTSKTSSPPDRRVGVHPFLFYLKTKNFSFKKE